jgi:hypothetical protein
MAETESASKSSTAPDSPKPKPSFRRRFRKFLFRVWLPIVGLFTAYLFYSYRATGFDPRVLASDRQIEVIDDGDSIRFLPASNARDGGLVFLPGSMVEPTAYAPLARRVAEAGYPVHILKLPLRSAPLRSQRDDVLSRARKVMTGTTNMRWVVGGHSFGAVLACEIAGNPPEQLAGVVLIGSSHPRDQDLSHSTLDITKVTATRDGLASPDRVKANAPNLPPQTRWIQIDGGNHSQFGYYGFQFGDHRATISRADQQDLTAKALLEALERASGSRDYGSATRVSPSTLPVPEL